MASLPEAVMFLSTPKLRTVSFPPFTDIARRCPIKINYNKLLQLLVLPLACALERKRDGNKKSEL